MAEHNVTHQADNHHFIITVDGEQAGFADYTPKSEGAIRDFNHTVIDDSFRGQGLAKELIRTALDETRDKGLLIYPTCSAVAGFVQKNPEYEDLVAH